ncbi:MAG: YggS family pyridoxal phosphate-dependent enzyme [Clostridiales bacterium]|nr:YggS family pyridoxal phosphate-dependent enzyme [Clostridiales bacterium]
MSIKENINSVKQKIEQAALAVNRDPHEISIVAVSKNITPETIQEAAEAGIKIIGENRVQELLNKYDNIQNNLSWHMIGYLQTNKVKYIIDKVELIHSLDRISLAKEINKRAGRMGRKVQALVQVNVSREESKSGIFAEELPSFIDEMSNYPNIEIKGLMTIGPNTEDADVIRACFRGLKLLYDELKNKGIDYIDMKYLSMGMSNDYEIAIQEGSNMVRIGRAIFDY